MALVDIGAGLGSYLSLAMHSVQMLMQNLVQFTDVALADQILLCDDGVRVYPQSPLSRYPLIKV